MLLRHASKARRPRPVAKSGREAGVGTDDSGALIEASDRLSLIVTNGAVKVCPSDINTAKLVPKAPKLPPEVPPPPISAEKRNQSPGANEPGAKVKVRVVGRPTQNGPGPPRQTPC